MRVKVLNTQYDVSCPFPHMILQTSHPLIHLLQSVRHTHIRREELTLLTGEALPGEYLGVVTLLAGEALPGEYLGVEHPDPAGDSLGGTVTGSVESVEGISPGSVGSVGCVGGTPPGPVVGVGGCTVRLTTSAVVASNRLLSNVKLSSPSEDGTSPDSAEVRLSVGREVGGASRDSSNNMSSISLSPPVVNLRNR